MEAENTRGKSDSQGSRQTQKRLSCSAPRALPSRSSGAQKKNGSSNNRIRKAGAGCLSERKWVEAAGDPGVIYRPIPSRPNYFAGSDGSIWSVFKGKARKRTLSTFMSGGKPRFQVSFRIDGKPRVNYVHRLVLEAFVGPCPEGMECCHNDGNATNNQIENLRWDTHQSNMLDRTSHGTANYAGENNGNSKINNRTVIEIMRRLNHGSSRREIADSMGIHRGRIDAIVRGRNWGHITGLSSPEKPGTASGRPAKRRKP